ncbi:peroxiredoxin-like 2A [Saccoglossus kowalevskii]
MGMLWTASLGAAVVGVMIANMNFWMPKEPATLKYLEDTTLKILGKHHSRYVYSFNYLDKEKTYFKAAELFKESGAVVLEAVELSSLRGELAIGSVHVPIFAVVHEELGVDEFAEYFDGDIFLDEEVNKVYNLYNILIIISLLDFF